MKVKHADGNNNGFDFDFDFIFVCLFANQEETKNGCDRRENE